MRVLLIGDDRRQTEQLRHGLREYGHVVEHAADGEEGLHRALTARYDVLVVDRMLPGRDGLTLMRMLRAGGDTTPVLFLSALGEVDERVEGLRAGGDDYLVKPFAFIELAARIEALARRRTPAPASPGRLRVGDLELDPARLQARREGRVIPLKPREVRLLEYLMRHAGQVVTRTMLLENVWDHGFAPQSNVVDVHVSRLRAKIDRGFARPLLHTVRGIGYRLGDDA